MRTRVVAFLLLGLVGCTGEHGSQQPVDSGSEPEPHLPINACDWDERGSRDAGENAVWAFQGPDCVRISCHDAGDPGVFATFEECQQTCPCVPSKFQNVPGRSPFPHCELVRIVSEDAQVPIIDRSTDDSFLSPGEMAELCQLSLDAGVAVMTCWWGE